MFQGSKKNRETIADQFQYLKIPENILQLLLVKIPKQWYWQSFCQQKIGIIEVALALYLGKKKFFSDFIFYEFLYTKVSGELCDARSKTFSYSMFIYIGRKTKKNTFLREFYTCVFRSKNKLYTIFTYLAVALLNAIFTWKHINFLFIL